METMKRILSAFLAMVLVLGMLPAVPAYAEETEGLPETQAVETTEAATEAPETTAGTEEPAPETEAAETEEPVPEATDAGTEPEETVPETTAAQETEPAQTEPQETTAGELVTEEALDAVETDVYVTSITVTPDKTEAYVGDDITLNTVVTPSDPVNKKVKFKVLTDTELEEYLSENALANYTVPAYDAEALEEGIVRAEECGTLYITWESEDGECKPFEEDKTLKPLMLKFYDYRMDINESAIEDENITEDDRYMVMVGQTMEVSLRYLRTFTDGVERAETPYLHTPDVDWELAEGDELYVDLRVSDDTTKVVITPKTVTQTKTITLTAKDQELLPHLPEGNAVDTIEILILPVPYKVSIRMEGEDGLEEINGKTIPVNIRQAQDDQEEWIEIPLEAAVIPEEANKPMIWSVSDNSSEIEHPLISEDPKVEDTTSGTLRMRTNTGKTVVTVVSKEDTSIKATVTFVRKRLLGEIFWTEKTKPLTDLVSGESFQLQVKDLEGKEGDILGNDVVKWELSDADQKYATLSDNGKLTAKKNLVRGKMIKVTCSVIDNEKEAFLEKYINIRPKGTDVEILDSEGTVLNGETLAFDTGELPADGDDPLLTLSARVYPLAENDVDLGALEDVKWTSSDAKIASVRENEDGDGEVEWEGRNGTVTITATAEDGSKKKASVTLRFGALVKGITIKAPNRVSAEGSETDFTLRSGKSWTFELEFTPKEPTVKDVTWSLAEGDEKYASLSAKGKLSAKTVYEEHTVTVRATAKDGSGVYDEVEVHILPKKDDQLSIQAGGEPVSKTTQLLGKGDSLDLKAYAGGAIDDTVRWKASNSKVAITDNEDGTATVEAVKSGSATITAKAEDGRSINFVIKVVQLADGVEWTHTHDQHNLASGKSLQLKAKAYYEDDDGNMRTPTVSKLAWSFQEEDADKYATISSSGKVTAKSGYRGVPVELTVVVKTTDGSDIQEPYSIRIAPVPEEVRILDENDNYITGGTFPMTEPGMDTIMLKAVSIPADEEMGYVWKSSNSKVAAITDNEDGTATVTCLKAGTVTITATANDGSGKKATYKLKIVAIPIGFQINCNVAYNEDDGYHVPIAGGKTLSLKATVMGLDEDGDFVTIKGKKLKWTFKDDPDDGVDGSAFVKSLSGSSLRTLKVSEPKRILVTVETVEAQEKWMEADPNEENWSVSVTFPVVIYPATTDVQILDDAGDSITQAHGDVGETVTLGAMAYPCKAAEDGAEEVALFGAFSALFGGTNPTGDACQSFTWKTSNKKVADFVRDEDGELVLDNEGNVQIECFKEGTVTITATAMDGTGKKATIKLYVW